MKLRSTALAFALAGGALLAGLTGFGADRAAAQLPPTPPATFWGTVTGGGVGPGWRVVAIVQSGSASATCGSGAVVTEGSQTVYVVDVVTDAQVPGCGANGRQIRFYLAPASPTGGRMANQTATWTGAGPVELNLTAGASLTNTVYAPYAARDGVN